VADVFHSFIAVALGAVVTALAGLLFVRGDRLRATASADLELVAAIDDPVARELLATNALRSVSVAVLRDTHPPLLPSEAVALGLSWLGLPIFAAVFGHYFDRWGLVFAAAVTVALLGVIAASTAGWWRRAVRRGLALAENPATTRDSRESATQAWLLLWCESIATLASLVVTAAIASVELGLPSNRWVSVSAALMTVVLAAAATVAPALFCAFDPGRPTPPDDEGERATGRGSAWRQFQRVSNSQVADAEPVPDNHTAVTDTQLPDRHADAHADCSRDSADAGWTTPSGTNRVLGIRHADQPTPGR
jgi:hypothetical protein